MDKELKTNQFVIKTYDFYSILKYISRWREHFYVNFFYFSVTLNYLEANGGIVEFAAMAASVVSFYCIGYSVAIPFSILMVTCDIS